MTRHAWNDSLRHARTLWPGQAVQAGQLIMVQTEDGVIAWGDCPLSGLVVLDTDPEPVILSADVEKFLKEMREQGKKRLDYQSKVVRQYYEWLTGSPTGSDDNLRRAKNLAAEGM